jgi:hypothetical protein
VRSGVFVLLSFATRRDVDETRSVPLCFCVAVAVVFFSPSPSLSFPPSSLTGADTHRRGQTQNNNNNNKTTKGACTFGPRLSDDDVRALSQYVLDRAADGWKAPEGGAPPPS